MNDVRPIDSRHSFRSFGTRVGVACLIAIASATPSLAQSPLQQHLDVTRMRAAARDSFVVLLRGEARGWQRLTMSRDGDGWQLGDAIEIAPMVTQSSVIRFDAQLAERSLRQEGKARGTDMRIALDFADGRVKGSSLTPSSGPTGALTVDTTVTPGIIDDNAVTPLLPAVRWSDGLSITFPVLSSGKGTVAQYTLRTLGSETITVPAGTFETWRVELVAENAAVTANVTKAAPYRVVRMQNGPAFEVQLVK
ncbi:MAG TPA: DUF3108 domain-containing protein [Gemmatimonadaceae bacterium]|nr:DUF3108 domain-containing protein [Gemmatimonadaceae bacterium]